MFHFKHTVGWSRNSDNCKSIVLFLKLLTKDLTAHVSIQILLEMVILIPKTSHRSQYLPYKYIFWLSLGVK